MKYSKGVSWIDDCRIPFVADDKFDLRRYETNSVFRMDNPQTTYEVNQPDTRGRFPANILVSDDMLNDGVITKQSQRTYKPTDNSASLFGNSPQSHGMGIGDSGSSSRYYDIDRWFNNLLNNC
jgi:hypothetical protein